MVRLLGALRYYGHQYRATWTSETPAWSSWYSIHDLHDVGTADAIVAEALADYTRYRLWSDGYAVYVQVRYRTCTSRRHATQWAAEPAPGSTKTTQEGEAASAGVEEGTAHSVHESEDGEETRRAVRKRKATERTETKKKNTKPNVASKP